MTDKRIVKSEKESAREIKIPHPDFGYVVFTNMTARQLDVLEDYLTCRKYVKKKDVKTK
jgi:hypothetical protein